MHRLARPSPRTPQISGSEYEADAGGIPVDLDRLAALVAGGEAPLPGDLPAPDAETLAENVARLRRRRLARFVARAIARDLSRGREGPEP